MPSDSDEWVKIGEHLEWDRDDTGLVVISMGKKDSGPFVRSGRYYLTLIRDKNKELKIEHPMATELSIKNEFIGYYFLLPEIWIQEEGSLWIEPIEEVREHWGVDNTLIFEYTSRVKVKDIEDYDEIEEVVQKEFNIFRRGKTELMLVDNQYEICIHIKPEFAEEIKGDQNCYLHNISLYYEEWDEGLLLIGTQPPIWWGDEDTADELLEFLLEYHALEPEWIRNWKIRPVD